MAKSIKDVLVPILFFAEGALWIGMVATGSGPLLGLAALSCILSGVFLLAIPSNRASRPLGGASALFGLVLTVYQGYQASTLLSSNLNNLGTYSFAVFAVFSVVYVYLELAMLSVGRAAESTKKP